MCQEMSGREGSQKPRGRNFPPIHTDTQHPITLGVRGTEDSDPNWGAEFSRWEWETRLSA